METALLHRRIRAQENLIVELKAQIKELKRLVKILMVQRQGSEAVRFLNLFFPSLKPPELARICARKFVYTCVMQPFEETSVHSPSTEPADETNVHSDLAETTDDSDVYYLPGETSDDTDVRYLSGETTDKTNVHSPPAETADESNVHSPSAEIADVATPNKTASSGTTEGQLGQPS